MRLPGILANSNENYKRYSFQVLLIFTENFRKLCRRCICYGRDIRVCPSVYLSHSGIMSKRGNAEGCNLHHRVSVSGFLTPRMVDGGLPCPEVDPCENSRAVYISPHNSGTVIGSEKVQSCLLYTSDAADE